MNHLQILSSIPTLAQAAHGAGKLSEHERQLELVPSEKALAALTLGDFSIQQWRHLADAANVSEMLTELQIAGNLRHMVDEGHAAIAELIASHQATGVWAANADQLQRINDMRFVFRVQLEHCSRRELDRAKHKVREFIRQVNAGKTPRNCIVHGQAVTTTSH
ncbi:hypothetical protein [Roseateles flavus]|uniref:Phasin domain-containing protein n=1 Tax=Roseateles flavus TaxID=3149041 RepID=A0ABV0GG36_9BURK